MTKINKINILVAIPKEWLEKIDKQVKDREIVTRRHWILEAIKDKLNGKNN